MFAGLYVLLSLTILSLIGWFHTLPAEAVDMYLAEDGFVETASAVGWFAAALTMAGFAAVTRWTKGGFGAVLLIAAALRELDFQKRFTTMSVSKIKFFLSGDVPVSEKIVVGAIFILLVWCGYLFIRGEIQPFLQRLRRREGPAIALAAFSLLLPASKVLDRLPNALREWGFSVAQGISDRVSIFEETLELGLPLLLLIVIVHFFCRSRQQASSRRPRS